MPRYMKPIPILKVESMSTGLPVDMDPPAVDDFTGEPIARVWPGAKPKVLQSAQAIRDEANRAKTEHARRLCEALGIGDAAQRSTQSVALPALTQPAVAAGLPSKQHNVAPKTITLRRI